MLRDQDQSSKKGADLHPYDAIKMRRSVLPSWASLVSTLKSRVRRGLTYKETEALKGQAKALDVQHVCLVFEFKLSRTVPKPSR